MGFFFTNAVNQGPCPVIASPQSHKPRQMKLYFYFVPQPKKSWETGGLKDGSTSQKHHAASDNELSVRASQVIVMLEP